MGIWAAKGDISFPSVMLITLSAGLLGSLILYVLGRTGGNMLLEKYLQKIPMVRTLVSIPAGVLKIDLLKYTLSSALGVFVWNLIFVGAGYFLGDAVLTWLT